MKSILFAFVLLLTSGAQAGLADFVGRFHVDTERCENFSRFSDLKRAYVYKTKNVLGEPVIQLDFYGADARIEEVLLESGKRKVLGTVPSVHGEVTVKWETEINEVPSENLVRLVSRKFTKRVDTRNPRFNFEREHGQILEREILESGELGTLTYTDYKITEEGPAETSCRLTPWN